MKKELVGITLLTFGLVAGFLILSCGPVPQNTNQNQSQNQSLSQGQKGDDAAATEDLPSDPDICKIANVGDRIEKLRAKLKKKIQGNNGKFKLADQFQGMDLDGKHYPPSFTYEFYPYPFVGTPTYVYLFIAGSVHGREPFQDLAEFAEDFVQKGCTDQVFFVGSLPRAGEELNFRDLGPFEWSGCEYPLLLCTDGECRNPCARKFGFDNSIANGNSNASFNSNVSTNSNSNANKGGNR